MAKKQSTKKRTRVKDLPKKEKQMSKGDMKKVKGGYRVALLGTVDVKADPTIETGKTGGGIK